MSAPSLKSNRPVREPERILPPFNCNSRRSSGRRLGNDPVGNSLPFSMTQTLCAARTSLCLAVIVLACRPHDTRPADSKFAIFAGGCFWCVEDAFDQVDGVTETISGYAGGTKPNPNYGDHESYQEAVKITYDPAKVTYAALLDHFW